MSERFPPLLKARPWSRIVPAAALSMLAVVAALTCLIDLAGWRLTRRVDARLAGATSIVVWTHGLESADAAQARAAEILIDAPGVRSVTLLDPRPDDEAIAAALGAPKATTRLLKLSVAPGAAPTLVMRLAKADLPARASTRPPAATGGSKLELIGLAVIVIALAVFALTCGIEAAREVRRGWSALELARLGGASDGWLTAVAARRPAGLTGASLLWGAAGALVGSAFIATAGPLPGLGGLTRADIISPWPLILVALGLAGLAAAWAAAASAVRRSP